MSAAYDWFLKIELARAEGEARRKRRQQEEEDYMRRAGQALALKSGAPERPPTMGVGVDARARKSLVGLHEASPRTRQSVPPKQNEEKAGGGGTRKGGAKALPRPSAPPQPLNPRVLAPVASNPKLAAGHQPVVIKVISYAGGAHRAGATAKYIQRDEVVLETHDSQLLDNHAAVEAEINHWSETFETRKPSQDVVTFGLYLAGAVDNVEGRAQLERAIAEAFAGHHHSWRFESRGDGQPLSAKAVVVMAGQDERFRIVEQGGIRRLAADTRKAIEGRLDEAGLSQAKIETISAPGHGREGASFQLRKLLAGGALQQGQELIQSVQDAKDVARVWTRELHSHGPRDTMHMVLSAKTTSAEEAEAFRKSVRGFLHETFPDHKFMFGLHGDKQGRIHAHAVVAVRGDNGEKLRPNRLTFLGWREAFAEKAQEQGLKLVATVARQQASSQSYGKFDKAIVDAADNPREGREAADIAYNRRFPHVAAAARHRMSVAKVNPPSWAVTEKQRAIAGASLTSWQDLARKDPGNLFALEQVDRLQSSLHGGRFIGALLEASQKDFATMTAVQMAASLARMNDLVNKASDNLSDQTKEAFKERSSKILTDYGTRIDLKRLQEAGVERISGEELKRIALFSGDKLIQRAREIEAVERREAEQARQVAGAAIDQERKDRSTGATSVEQTELDKLATQEALHNSEKQAREARAASTAVQDLSSNPAKPLDQGAVQSSEHMKNLQNLQSDTIKRIKAEAEKEGPEKAKPTKQK